MKNFHSAFYSFSILALFLGVLFTSQYQEGPIASIGTLSGGEVDATTFQEFKGMNATKGAEVCKVVSYEMVWVAKKQDPVMSINYNANFNTKSLNLAAKAESKTIYYFDNIRVKCAGDAEERKVNSLVFKIN